MKGKILIGIIITFFIPSALFAADPFFNQQTYLGYIDYSPSYKSISSGKGVIVAVIDEGVWQEHPDLKNSIWVNTKEIPQNGIDDDGNGYIDDYYGWDFIGNNSNVEPYGSHGTMVAGIIAAAQNDIGITGIAPDVKIMSLLACATNGCSMTGVIRAIKYAVDNGAKVINLSLGGAGYVGFSSQYDESIKYAYDHDVVVVASAGNGDVNSSGQVGQDLDFIKVSPVSNDVGGINMVLGVGALIDQKTKVNFSNYGATVDAWAPGKDILSTTVPSFAEGFGYDTASGTSFSAPMISAAVALLRSIHPELKNWEIIDTLKDNEGGLLRVHEIITGAVDARFCKIPNLTKTITNGTVLRIPALHLKQKAQFSLKNLEGAQYPLSNGLTILDANQFELNFSKLKIPAGTYSFVSNNSACDVSFNTVTITGDPITAMPVLQPIVVIPPKVSSPVEKKRASQPNLTPLIDIPIGPTAIAAPMNPTTTSISDALFSDIQDETIKQSLKNKILIDNAIIDKPELAGQIQITPKKVLDKIPELRELESLVVQTQNGGISYELVLKQKAKLFGFIPVTKQRTVTVFAQDSNEPFLWKKGFFDFFFKFYK